VGGQAGGRDGGRDLLGRRAKDSLPHSQVHATCPYFEPAQSSLYLFIPLPEVPS
jgi:hypothetical protein